MRNSPYCIIAVKTIILSLFGLSTLPLLAIIAQYIDSVVGFSFGQGYHSVSSQWGVTLGKPVTYFLGGRCPQLIL